MYTYVLVCVNSVFPSTAKTSSAMYHLTRTVHICVFDESFIIGGEYVMHGDKLMLTYLKLRNLKT